MAHDRNRDVENLLAAAADRTRSARAELAAAARDLSLPADHRLTDQQRALTGDIFAKLVAAIELDLRQQLASVVTGVDTDAGPAVRCRLEQVGVLQDATLLRLLVRRAEEHRLALVAAGEGSDIAADTGLLDALARNPDAELARRAVAYVVGDARRRDRFREPLLLSDDLPEHVAWTLHWQVAAALRAHLRETAAIGSTELEPALEGAVRQAMADHREGQGGHARASRLAARLDELGELGDDFLRRTLAQGHVALFAAGLGVRAGLGADPIWDALLDRGRRSLVVLLRAIDMPAATAAAIVEILEAGGPLVHPPASQRALFAGYDAIDRSAAAQVLRGWRLDPGFRAAIADVEGAGRR